MLALAFGFGNLELKKIFCSQLAVEIVCSEFILVDKELAKLIVSLILSPEYYECLSTAGCSIVHLSQTRHFVCSKDIWNYFDHNFGLIIDSFQIYCLILTLIMNRLINIK